MVLLSKKYLSLFDSLIFLDDGSDLYIFPLLRCKYMALSIII